MATFHDQTKRPLSMNGRFPHDYRKNGGCLLGSNPEPLTRYAHIYALLDCRRVICPEHLEAAVAIWDYAEASVTLIFGDLTGDAIAVRLLVLLQTEGQMTRNDLYDAFGRNVSSARISNALDLLHRAKRILARKVAPESGEGRPRTVYEAVNANADPEVSTTRLTRKTRLKRTYHVNRVYRVREYRK